MNRIVSSSHEQGEMFTLQHSRVGKDLQKFIHEMRSRFDWLLGVELQKDVQKAKLWFRPQVETDTRRQSLRRMLVTSGGGQAIPKEISSMWFY